MRRRFRNGNGVGRIPEMERARGDPEAGDLLIICRTDAALQTADALSCVVFLCCSGGGFLLIHEEICAVDKFIHALC
jgi:hypothetical protein